MMKRVWTALAVSSLVAVASPLTATAQEKPALSAQEYGRWESLGGPVISPFGDWVATVVRPSSSRLARRRRSPPVDSG